MKDQYMLDKRMEKASQSQNYLFMIAYFSIRACAPYIIIGKDGEFGFLDGVDGNIPESAEKYPISTLDWPTVSLLLKSSFGNLMLPEDTVNY